MLDALRNWLRARLHLCTIAAMQSFQQNAADDGDTRSPAARQVKCTGRENNDGSHCIAEFEYRKGELKNRKEINSSSLTESLFQGNQSRLEPRRSAPTKNY